MTTIDSVHLLQQLIRFDTTNPPGDEAACVQYLKAILEEAGIPTRLLALDKTRPNLIARLSGRGEAPPLLLQGHIDVVPTTEQRWTHPPFAAEIADGMIWGRGALDDKGAVAMMTTVLLRAASDGFRPPGDVILTVVADEEAAGTYGARFLVERHPEEFEGVQFAIGEGGGFAVHMSGAKFYPIMVAEKQHCTLRVTVRGRAGHGSVPLRGGAMAKLSEVLRTLDRERLPVHLLPVTKHMIKTLSEGLPLAQGIFLRRLLNPALTNHVLDLLGDQGNQLNPLLHNTVSPTRLHGSDAVNVIPGAVTVDLDGRLLPGFGPEDLVAELRGLLGEEPEIEVLHFEQGPPQADMDRYEILAQLLQEADPEGMPVPHLLSGVTDARHFARLGISTYGFVPLDLPPGLVGTIHAADERVPVESIHWGTEVLYDLLHRFRG